MTLWHCDENWPKLPILWWGNFSTPSTLESFHKSRRLLNNSLKGKGERKVLGDELWSNFQLNWKKQKNHPAELFGCSEFCPKEAVIGQSGWGSYSFMWTGLCFSIRKEIRGLSPFRGMLTEHPWQVLAFQGGSCGPWSCTARGVQSGCGCPEAHRWEVLKTRRGCLLKWALCLLGGPLDLFYSFPNFLWCSIANDTFLLRQEKLYCKYTSLGLRNQWVLTCLGGHTERVVTTEQTSKCKIIFVGWGLMQLCEMGGLLRPSSSAGPHRQQREGLAGSASPRRASAGPGHKSPLTEPQRKVARED